MPSVGDSLPLRVATEQVKCIVSVILTNRKPRHRAQELAGDNLLARTRETVALVDR
ncbi:MAG: hypothetical protein H8K10_16250 [Nitrospira sp.]|nr:hypothetical protein [Nitrospira sp.]